MTLVLAWLEESAGDQKLHIATDSLLSDDEGKTWHYGTKIFQFFPTLCCFAYCGKSLGALHFVLQGITLISYTDVLSHHGNSVAPQLCARVSALKEHLYDTLKLMPSSWGRDCTVLCVEYNDRLSRFELFTVTISDKGVVLEDYEGQTSPPLSKHGDFLAFGSGHSKAEDLIQLNAPDPATRDQKRFLSTLQAVMDNKTIGGSPQMVTLTKSGLHPVGFKQNNSVTLFGMPVKFKSKLEKVTFLDENFDRLPQCESMRLRGAMTVRRISEVPNADVKETKD